MNHFDMMRSCVYGLPDDEIWSPECGIRNPEQRSKFRKVRILLFPIRRRVNQFS